MTTYKTFDVLEVQPATRDRFLSLTQTKSRVDSDAGRLDERAVHTPNPIGQRDFLYVADGASAVFTLKSFITGKNGMQTPFWVPTWTRDLLPTATATVGATTLIVSSALYTTLVLPQTDYGRRHIALLHPSGTFQYRGITGSTQGSGVETLTLASALTLAVTPDVTLVGYLTFCRMASDSVTIKWYNPTYAEAILPLQELPREAPAP